jgi:hypothetical protein
VAVRIRPGTPRLTSSGGPHVSEVFAVARDLAKVAERVRSPSLTLMAL